MDYKNCTPKLWLENEIEFEKILMATAVWDDIPLLNVNSLNALKDSSLVRFRGMIQDMHSPEYYLETFEVVNQNTGEKTTGNGKYQDVAITNKDEIVDFDSTSNKTAERQTYVVISIPGLNNWVTLFEEERYQLPNEKSPPKTNSIKRCYDEVIDAEDNCVGDYNNSRTKKSNTVISEFVPQNTHYLSMEYVLNFPLPEQIDSKTCHLKLYKGTDDLKLNDVCEFVGFLATDPIIEAAYQEVEAHENRMEMETLHPPSSLIPRIHCVGFRKLTHCNPLLPLQSEPLPMERIEFIRKELLIVLTQLLLGDALAAEYLLLQMVSEIYSRKDFLQLGKFSLNISNIPSLQNINYITELYRFVENLVTKSYYLPMTLDNMNDLTFIPKKDYECNRLTSGILQLSSNTLVVLDETKLTNGQLDASGVNNLRALSSVIKNQSLSYDFGFYKIDFDCDIPFLILSEGKSMLNCDFHIVLKPEQICLDTFTEILEAARHFLRPDLLNDMRKYLTLARFTEYEIKEKTEELVQNEYIEMKKRGSVTADDLHSLLVLARLICISRGRTSLDEECWKKACQLESARRNRIVR